MVRKITVGGAAAIVFEMLAVCLFAQFIPGGNVQVTVKDPTGAFVPNATVTLTNSQTGVAESSIKSGQGGQALFRTVPPGMYRVQVTAAGFQTAVQENVPVQVGQTTTVDVALKVGNTKQTVTVTGAAPILNTVSGSVGTVVSNVLIQNLPLGGRNPMMLEFLVPGVNWILGAQFGDMNVFQSNGVAQGLGTFQSSYVSIGGSNTRQNAFMLDSTQNNHNEQIGFVPNVDQVQELAVVPNAYDAQNGVGATTIVAVTKSGTNQFHGNLFDFVQNNIFNANNFFSNLAGAPVPALHYNQFGGSIGGPILLPRFNGRDKAFFFFNYEGIRQPSGSTQVGGVPTPAQRQGDFNGTIDSAGEQIQIFNPFTPCPNPATCTRNQFPNNTIPSSLIDPASAKIMALLPQPNLASSIPGVGNYEKEVHNNLPQNLWNARVDYNLSSKNRLYGRTSWEKFDFLPGTFLIAPDHFNYGALSTALDWTSTLNPQTVMEISIGYNRHFNDFIDPTVDLASLGFASNLAAFTNYFPSMSIQDFGSIGNGQPDILHDDDWSGNIDFRRSQGKHNLKWGFQYVLNRNEDGFYDYAVGFTFDRSFTQGPVPTTSGANIGYGLASFLLGTESMFNPDSITSPLATAVSSPMYGAYFQDDYRVTPKLSVNLGLRWDAWLPGAERYNRQQVDFLFDQYNPLQFQVQPAYAAECAATPPSPACAVLPPSQFNLFGGTINASPSHRRWAAPVWGNLEPRVGFAYRLDNKTVLRGGFGMFRTMWFYNNSQSNGFQSTTPILSTIDGVTPNVLYTNPIPNGLIPPADNLGMLTGVGVGENFNDPYTEPEENTRWSFGFQRELTPTTTLEANYVGETTFHLPLEGGGSAFIDFSSSKQHSQRLQLAYLPTQYGSLGNNLFESVPNPFFGIDSNLLAGTALASPNIPLFNLLVRYPQFGPENLGEYFDTAGMSYYHSFQMTLTKRASHGLSVLGSYTFQKTLDRYFFLNPEDAGPTKELGLYDAPQKIAVGAVYELPFGPGRRFGSMQGPLGKIIGGWQYSLNEIFQSGTPIMMDAPIVWNGQNPALPASQRSRFKWFNTAAFTPQQQLNLRTAPWLIPGLRYDAVNNWDMALIKNTVIHENAQLQFRWEVFNAFNHVMWGAPVNDPTNPGFGQIFSQGNQPRSMQLALELTF
jgi:hypothetical protein